MLSAIPVDDSIECRSLTEESWVEAVRERWYQSERAGRDVGESAIRHWVHRHWPGFLRARWIEHMLGQRFWIELGRDEFGILRDTPLDLRPVLDQIIGRLKCGAENLDIVRWSCHQTPAEKEAVRKFLEAINVNAHRFRCHFADD
jgi:hypothetical protein